MKLIKTLILFISIYSYSFGASAKRPNILWLITDNCNLDFGCFGMQGVHTPHIDKLATQGVRYTKVFATAPVCAPSRSAFMTGMYQTSVNLHHFPDHRDDGFRLPEGVRPMTHRLKDAGYTTGSIKMMGKDLVGSGKLDLNFVNEGKIFESTKWEDIKKSRPFFLQVNTPEAEYDIYDFKTNRPERVKWWGEDEHIPYAKPDEVVPPAYFPKHPTSNEEWARYLEFCFQYGPTHWHCFRTTQKRRLTRRHHHRFVWRQWSRRPPQHSLGLRHRSACPHDHQMA